MADVQDVVGKLAELTDRGQIPWKSTADESAFAANFGNLSVLITARPSPHSSASTAYRLSVLDEKGYEIDSSTATWRPGLTGIRLPTVVPLYASAKRAALGVDRRLEELLQAIDQLAESQ